MCVVPALGEGRTPDVARWMFTTGGAPAAPQAERQDSTTRGGRKGGREEEWWGGREEAKYDSFGGVFLVWASTASVAGAGTDVSAAAAAAGRAGGRSGQGPNARQWEQQRREWEEQQKCDLGARQSQPGWRAGDGGRAGRRRSRN